MAVKIRMRRMGRTNRPYFRIVAADERCPRDGRFLENLGTYDPLAEGKNYTLVRERMIYWLGVGAQASEAVATFLKKDGILQEIAAKKPEKLKKPGKSGKTGQAPKTRA